MPMTQSAFALAAFVAVATFASADQPGGSLIANMDELKFAAPKAKGKVELVEGKIGKALRFTVEKDSPGTFFTSAIRGTAAWDEAAGISFWVKGDGSDQFAGLQFIYDDDYALRYDLCFAIKGKEWTKVTAAWTDFIPVLPGPKSKPLGAKGNAPSKIGALWVGKWWYWGDYPVGSFAIDEIRLEATIVREAKDYAPPGDPLARVREKVKAGRPITVVTMGDSLTDTRHWANREVVWQNLLAEKLKAEFKSGVTIVNPAIGGTQLRKNLVLIPRWLDRAPEPDLVTIFFGGNDWDAGMRGPEFAAACEDAIDRVRRATKGKADVLLMTTNPSVAGWDTIAELSAACRRAAKAKKAGLADTFETFHIAGKEDRERLFVKDKVHLSPAGHALVAATVLKAIGAGAK